MILSHRHRFIFIKTSKTAGTSIEISLSRHCGPRDVVTPVTRTDERLRARCGGRGPQNFRVPITQLSPMDLLRTLRGAERPLRFWNHISAREVRDLVGMRTWGRYFTFCVARNPWDRVMSAYYWRTRSTANKPSLTEFLNEKELSLLRERGYENYSMDGRVIVDKVVIFDDLQDELDAIARNLGLCDRLVLPSAKSGLRDETVSRREFFDPETKEIVRSYFAEEIELFGFSF